MNIFLLTQYYPPEPSSASMRMGEIGEYLAGKGHEVTVVTGFPNYPDGKVYDGYKMRPMMREIVKLGNRESGKRGEAKKARRARRARKTGEGR